ncbi:MAG TPA: hypothetical protein VGO79_06370 [Thermoanaerobaculia bacterium]
MTAFRASAPQDDSCAGVSPQLASLRRDNSRDDFGSSWMKWDIPLDTFPTSAYSFQMSERAEKGVYSVRLRPDSKGRITLGKLADGVSSYRARRQKDGKIILEPFVEIPAEEQWLWKNKKALEAVRRGIADSKAGRVTSLGSFRKYAK